MGKLSARLKHALIRDVVDIPDSFNTTQLKQVRRFRVNDKVKNRILNRTKNSNR